MSRRRHGTQLLAALASVLIVAAAAGPASAAADFIAPQHTPPTSADGWQAGTCTTDTPTQCSVDTPGQFFTQAAGHPGAGFTQFIVQTDGTGAPVQNIKDVRVDLPTGLSVDPAAVPQCPQATFAANPAGCAGSEVGTSFVTVHILGIPPAPPVDVTLPFTVYNLDPPNNVPLEVAFSTGITAPTYIVGGVSWNTDYHELFTINNIDDTLPIIKNRLVFNGTAGGSYITNPSTCFDPTATGFEHVYSTYLRADSYQAPDPSFPANSPFIESPLPPAGAPTGCAAVPFKPSVGVVPGTTQTDSPAAPTFNVDVPFNASDAIANSNMKTARVTLPAGMGINPSAANGLLACTDNQLGKGTTNPVSCPGASKVGTVAIHSPALPGPISSPQLTGDVYVGQPLSNDAASGNQFRVFVDAESSRYGLSIRLKGNVIASPTGQLTAVFPDLPQNPFDAFNLTFTGGAKAALSSPPTCGPNKLASQLTPYSGTADATPSASFTLTSSPIGGQCAKTLASRPFAPGFSAKTTNSKAGKFSQFDVHITRPDGAQEITQANVDLAPGMTAKLAGIPYCPQSAINKATNSSGKAEKGAPSCPGNSLIGSADVDAGTGPSPLHVDGNAYLAGPYKGAPLSMVVVTPAVAGPYDLGTVVVRVALYVDPYTAQIHAVSDPIPSVFDGVRLDIRTIDIDVNRKQFALNGTNCSPFSITGTLFGGGADPSNPAAYTQSPASSSLRLTDCGSLGFSPKLYLRLFGHKKDFRRSGHPQIRAVLMANDGDANLSRVAATLPKGLQLDQSHIRGACTRTQLDSGTCGRQAIYGSATAYTPLLSKPVSGPVYLVSLGNTLPDLVAALQGQVNVNVDGRIDTNKKGQIRNTFDAVPDIPVTKFVLQMQGGKKGLLVPNRNLCMKRHKATVKIKSQSGATANQKPKLRIPCHGKAKKHKRANHK